MDNQSESDHHFTRWNLERTCRVEIDVAIYTIFSNVSFLQIADTSRVQLQTTGTAIFYIHGITTPVLPVTVFEISF